MRGRHETRFELRRRDIDTGVEQRMKEPSKKRGVRRLRGCIVGHSTVRQEEAPHAAERDALNRYVDSGARFTHGFGKRGARMAESIIDAFLLKLAQRGDTRSHSQRVA